MEAMEEGKLDLDKQRREGLVFCVGTRMSKHT